MMMQRPHFFAYRNYYYLKAAGLLALAFLLAYWLSKPSGGAAYGGTVFGYVSGIVSALIVLLLSWYGVRKRRPPRLPDKRAAGRRKQAASDTPYDPERRKAQRRSQAAAESWRHGGNLRGWLSAHVHLGTALLILATLHSGFRLAWNLHSLAYILLLLVLASGVYGAYAYIRFPRLITENNSDESLSDILLKIAELDELARFRALGLPDKVNTLVWQARTSTRIGGTFLQQFSGKQHDCPTTLAVERVHELGKTLVDNDQLKLMRDLYAVLVQKQRLVAKARKEISLNARMQFWVYLHAPLAIALLAALLAHVSTILIYW